MSAAVGTKLGQCKHPTVYLTMKNWQERQIIFFIPIANFVSIILCPNTTIAIYWCKNVSIVSFYFNPINTGEEGGSAKLASILKNKKVLFLKKRSKPYGQNSSRPWWRNFGVKILGSTLHTYIEKELVLACLLHCLALIDFHFSPLNEHLVVIHTVLRCTQGLFETLGVHDDF